MWDAESTDICAQKLSEKEQIPEGLFKYSKEVVFVLFFLILLLLTSG